MTGFAAVLRLLQLSVLFLAGHALAAEQAQPAQPGNTTARYKLVIQVSDADPANWNLALTNARNVQSSLGANNVDIEVVAYGPGLRMLTLESAASERVRESIAGGIRIVACENTMKVQKLTRDDMLPSLHYVEAGVVEVIVRQQQGYAYVRP